MVNRYFPTGQASAFFRLPVIAKMKAGSTSALGAILLALLTVVSANAAEPALGPLNMDTPALSPAEAKALRNPVSNTIKSIGRGRLLFATSGCASCHGSDGKALIEVVANATDLTNPKVWKNGTDEGQIFRSIRDGAGVAMPAFKGQITQEQDIWNIVNFIHSLWPQDQRPLVVAE
jgi:Cytochrome C oxidase, cbb3-type, subunit III